MSGADWTDHDLVDELLGIESGLSEWEVEFAESLDDWLGKGRSLTDRQRGKAQEILEGKA